MKKVLILFLALLLPVLIYLFLKSFGKNEFEVPVLFADSVSIPQPCNAFVYQAPYTVADSLLEQMAWSDNALTLFVFEDGIKERTHERNIHIGRVFTEFKGEPLQVVRISKDPVEENLASGITERMLSGEDFRVLHDCVFLMEQHQDAVLVDAHKRIRGQYNLLKREDADRMIMQEMNILFKRY